MLESDEYNIRLCEDGTIRHLRWSKITLMDYLPPEVLDRMEAAIAVTKQLYAEKEADKYIIDAWNRRAWDQYREQEAKDNAEKPPPPPKYVYVIHDPTTSYYKIGFSSNPLAREKTLQSERPTLFLVATYAGTLSDEKALHKDFKSKKIRGEWFALTEDDLVAIDLKLADKKICLEGQLSDDSSLTSVN